MILLLSLISLAFAQGPATALVPQMVLPDGNGSWVVEVFTSGGILGNGGGDFAVSSQGRMTCSLEAMRCPKEFMPSALQPLVDLFQPERLPGLIPQRALLSSCSDCLTRTMVIRRRDTMGIEQTYSVSWNDLTRSAVPQEMLRIYDALTALRK